MAMHYCGLKRQGTAGGVADKDLLQTEILLAFLLKMFGIALFELFNTTGGIDKFLFSCEERMTGRANFHPDFRFYGAEVDFIATCAYSFYVVIFRMYSSLHDSLFLQYTFYSVSNI